MAVHNTVFITTLVKPWKKSKKGSVQFTILLQEFKLHIQSVYCCMDLGRYSYTQS